MNSWKNMLTKAFQLNDDSWENVEANTMTEDEMNKEFNDDYGGTEGCWFTVWTKKAVYFPACYDGSEWVGYVSRHPDGVATDHVGGG